jgi:glycine/D-amino acid oxidase-like deaminating enzyme
MADVIVVGAGLPGLMIAWRAAQAGLEVTVFDRSVIGGGSSSLAAGHVPAAAELACDLAVLRRTRSLVREIGDRTGSVVYFREVGGLELAADPRAGDHLQDRADRMRGLVSDVTILSAAEVAVRWPLVRSDDLRAAIWSPGDWLVRSIYLVVGLAALARLAGATIIEGCAVDAVALRDDHVDGVVIDGDTVRARAVVLAAGAATSQIARNAGILLPLRLAALDLAGLLGVPAPLPFISEHTPGAERPGYYLINPVPGWLLAGAPIREGAGAWGGQVTPDGESIDYLTRAVARRIQDVGRPVSRSGWSGLLETTPDGRALVGEWPHARGLYLASGFGGSGVQRVAIAEAVASQITGTPVGVDQPEFRAARFADYDGGHIPLWDGPYERGHVQQASTRDAGHRDEH